MRSRANSRTSNGSGWLMSGTSTSATTLTASPAAAPLNPAQSTAPRSTQAESRRDARPLVGGPATTRSPATAGRGRRPGPRTRGGRGRVVVASRVGGWPTPAFQSESARPPSAEVDGDAAEAGAGVVDVARGEAGPCPGVCLGDRSAAAAGSPHSRSANRPSSACEARRFESGAAIRRVWDVHGGCHRAKDAHRRVGVPDVVRSARSRPQRRTRRRCGAGRRARSRPRSGRSRRAPAPRRGR